MKLALAVVACILGWSFLSFDQANALGADWIREKPVKQFDKDIPFTWTPHCPTYYQPLIIEGREGRTAACYFGGEKVKVAMSYPDSGNARLLVAPVYSNVFSEVQGICERIANCVYSPESDTLIARYDAYTYRGVEVYKNVLSRIRYVTDPFSGVSQYVFNRLNPDMRFKNGDKDLPVEAVSISNNGKWAAWEYRGYGMMLIDLTTLSMRRIQAPGYRYGWSLDPTAELAVSNDGQLVAVVGERLGLAVIYAELGCGDTIYDGMGENYKQDVTYCSYASTDYPTYIESAYAVYDPYFNDDASRLDVTILSRTGRAKRVGIGIASSQPRLDYLALGDSFTSGEGELYDYYYQPQTNDEYEKCHLSTRSYPYLLKKLQNFGTARSVACSGAKMGDIFGGSGYLGQGSRLGLSGLKLLPGEINQWQDVALRQFIPGRVQQGDFLQVNQPRVVSVGIGGNDAGFMTKLKACALPGECEWVTDEGRRKTAFEIRALGSQLVAFYQKIITTSPNSKVVVVGYPKVIQEDGVCDPLTSLLLSKNERRFMNEGLLYLNQVIQAAAQIAKLVYVDTGEVFAGRELCSGAKDIAMNGVRPGDDGIINNILPIKLIGNESFHPTPVGHQLLAEAISQKLVLEQLENCTDCTTLPSEYWGNGTPEVISKYMTFTDAENVNGSDQPIALSFPANTFKPDSVLRIEIHSTPKTIATLRSDDQGAVTTVIRIPPDLEAGFHTLHAFGVSADGKDIEFYQEMNYVPVMNPNSDQQIGNPPLQENFFSAAALSGYLGVKDTATMAAKVVDKIKQNLFPFFAALIVYIVVTTVTSVLIVRKFMKHTPP